MNSGSGNETSGGSGFEENSGSGSEISNGSDIDVNVNSEPDIQTSINAPTIKIATCALLYHGFDVFGEIYPWYQFRSVRISWRGIKVF